jgi:tetratricopeptide (TPR) repeat protein
MPLPLIRLILRGAAGAGLACLLIASAPLRAADDANGSSENNANTPPEQTLSDAVGDGISKIRPLLDAKDWNGAERVIDELIKGAKPDSYDMDVLLDTKARIRIQKTDYTGAIEPMEQALAIADRHHFNSTKNTMDVLYILSQMYLQAAEDPKTPKDRELPDYEKAQAYIERWFTLSPKQNEDVTFYYASLLYYEAVAKNPEHPDVELVKKAQSEVEKVLLMSIHPKDQAYAFLLATLNQQQDYKRAAEILELMLARNPSNKSYWADLVMFYMTLGQQSKEERMSRMYNIRAINTIERAQALGFMKSQKDNFNLFTLYYNSNQYGTAADILHAGLKAGTIDGTLANWQLLASSYEQINRDFDSIQSLKEASEKYPKDGELDFKIAQVYYGMNNLDQAFSYGKAAMEKGSLAKPAQTYEFISYLAYELQKYDDAKTAINKAIEAMEAKQTKPDHQVLSLRNAIDEAIKEKKDKEAKKAEAATKAQDAQQSQ